MNNTISINMKFWDDGIANSTRIRNVTFCWEKLKSLTNFMRNKDINVDCFLFDFSPNKIISDSIHISYPLGVYNISEKTNIILNKQKNYNFFMMMDCDAFFHENDYDKLSELINNLMVGDVITFDLAKLEDNVNEYIKDDKFIIENANWSYAYSGDRNKGPLNGVFGGLGGVYIVDTKLIIQLGGFNEKYKGWGEEDGEMLNRIWTSKTLHNIKLQSFLLV